MILALLMVVATPAEGSGSVIEADRALASDAQTFGYWTAFRKWAAPDATMFMPQPIKAIEFLKDKADPSRSSIWGIKRSYQSCDGSAAVNTGPWTLDAGSQNGYFTTIWRRGTDGWRWILDSGDSLEKSREAFGEPVTVIASCTRPILAPRATKARNGDKVGDGQSDDGSLRWSWSVNGNDDRRVRIQLWNGKGWDLVIDDRVSRHE